MSYLSLIHFVAHLACSEIKEPLVAIAISSLYRYKIPRLPSSFSVITGTSLGKFFNSVSGVSLRLKNFGKGFAIICPASSRMSPRQTLVTSSQSLSNCTLEV